VKNSSVRNVEVLLNRSKVLDSEHEGDKGAAMLLALANVEGKNGRAREPNV